MQRHERVGCLFEPCALHAHHPEAGKGPAPVDVGLGRSGVPDRAPANFQKNPPSMLSDEQGQEEGPESQKDRDPDHYLPSRYGYK